MPEPFFDFDITEIEGFDNLHQAESILKDLQQKAAEYYGAEETYYLVNGSTAGILSAVSAALPAGGHLLMARNCHKSVYNAVRLLHLNPVYLYPEYSEEYDMFLDIGEKQKEEIRILLEEHPGIKAVVITSPTYEGVVSDVAGIKEILEPYGIPLIVDEAHGAHFGFHPYFPEI
jgi:arginine/lysine/ornithine decarboxylase